MTAETLQDWMRKRPFQPFQVRTSAGDTYAVRHPEMAFLTRTEILIGVIEHDGIRLRYRTVSLLHVTAIEPLDASAAV